MCSQEGSIPSWQAQEVRWTGVKLFKEQFDLDLSPRFIWAPTSGAAGLEALELADNRVVFMAPPVGRITAPPAQSWSSKGELPEWGMIYTVLAGRDCEHHLNKDLCFPSGKIVASHSEKGSERSASHVTETISTVSKCFSHITIMVFATSLPISKSSFLTLL